MNFLLAELKQRVVDGKFTASRLHERQEFEESELPHPPWSASAHLLLLPLISVCLISRILETKSSHEEQAHYLGQEEKTLGRDSLGCKSREAFLLLSAFVDIFEHYQLMNVALVENASMTFLLVYFIVLIIPILQHNSISNPWPTSITCASFLVAS